MTGNTSMWGDEETPVAVGEPVNFGMGGSANAVGSAEYGMELGMQNAHTSVPLTTEDLGRAEQQILAAVQSARASGGSEADVQRLVEQAVGNLSLPPQLGAAQIKQIVAQKMTETDSNIMDNTPGGSTVGSAETGVTLASIFAPAAYVGSQGMGNSEKDAQGNPIEAPKKDHSLLGMMGLGGIAEKIGSIDIGGMFEGLLSGKGSQQLSDVTKGIKDFLAKQPKSEMYASANQGLDFPNGTEVMPLNGAVQSQGIARGKTGGMEVFRGG